MKTVDPVNVRDIVRHQFLKSNRFEKGDYILFFDNISADDFLDMAKNSLDIQAGTRYEGFTFICFLTEQQFERIKQKLAI